MKIGFDAKRAFHNSTGLGNYSRDLIKNLIEAKKNYKIYLYTPKVSDNPRFKFIQKLSNVFVKTPTSFFNKLFKGAWRSILLEKTLKQDNLEIYHGLSNEIPKRNKDSKGIKYIVTIHDLIFIRYPKTYSIFDRYINNVKFKHAVNNADVIIAISNQTKLDIIKYYNIPESKIQIVYQTCHMNFKKTYLTSQKEEVRAKNQLPYKYILNVGTIETRKNLNALIQAVPLMKNELPIVVIGKKTKYYEFLLTEIKRLNIDPKRFLFLSDISINELPLIYQMATVFVYPSVFEGFGIPIIEALYSGTPVITTKGGCFPEAGGPNSIYVDTQNYLELANSIDSIINDTEQQKSMINNGLKYVEKFDAQVLTQELISIYEALK